MSEINSQTQEIINGLKDAIEKNVSAKIQPQIEEINKVTAELRSANDKVGISKENFEASKQEVEKLKAEVAKTKSENEKYNKEIEKLEKMQIKLDAMEVASAKMSNAVGKKEERASKADIVKFLYEKKINGNLDKELLEKVLRTNTLTEGQPVLQIGKDVMYQENYFTDFAKVIRPMYTNKKISEIIAINVRTAGSEQLPELGTADRQAPAPFKVLQLPLRKTKIIIPVTEEMLDFDTEINVENLINQIAMDEYQYNREKLLTNGTGGNEEPLGIMKDTDVRELTQSTGTDLVIDNLSKMKQLLGAYGSGYKVGAMFMFNSDTEHKLRIAKDGNDKYLLLDPTKSDDLGKIWGTPYITNDYMQDYGTSTNAPIILGNFSKYFRVMEMNNLLVDMDKNITGGWIDMAFRGYMGSKVIDDRALVKLVLS